MTPSDRLRKLARPLPFALLALAAATPAPAASDTKKGLWFGPVHLCRDTVVEAVAGVDEYSGQPSLTLTLAPRLQPRLQRETARRVSRTIKIRLDGIVVQAPKVHEPIRGTSLHLAGFSREQAERIRAAALQPC